jgi:hypothetical protein
MPYAYTHPVPTGAPVTAAGLPGSRGLFTRAGAIAAKAVAALVVHEPPADRIYGQLLERSGGKLTDALEREADRRLRGS